MKYAIISDVHGNYHALKAALADAEKQGVDMYLFIGDYSYGFPWGNEVVDAIRGIENKAIIRGNGENYIIDFHDKEQSEWNLEQFKPVYWACRTFSKENIEYLITLPESLTITDCDFEINLNHAMGLFYRTPKLEMFYSWNFRQLMTISPFTHEEYLIRAKEELLSRADTFAEIEELPKGIYLFGHNHIQFYMEHEGKVFINPGSCGEALDWSATAAYTILDITDGDYTVSERRVTYDLDAVAKGLRSSGYYDYAPVWSDVMERGLVTGKDYFFPLLLHLIATGKELGLTEFPVSNYVWDKAIQTWNPTQGDGSLECGN
jgi:predicted phosphodiesterase